MHSNCAANKNQLKCTDATKRNMYEMSYKQQEQISSPFFKCWIIQWRETKHSCYIPWQVKSWHSGVHRTWPVIIILGTMSALPLVVGKQECVSVCVRVCVCAWLCVLAGRVGVCGGSPGLSHASVPPSTAAHWALSPRWCCCPVCWHSFTHSLTDTVVSAPLTAHCPSNKSAAAADSVQQLGWGLGYNHLPR